MGLTKAEIYKFLKYAKDYGISGKSVTMIGKQDILMNLAETDRMLKQLGLNVSDTQSYNNLKAQRLLDSHDFFKMLGFAEIHSTDISDFEGADLVFNLNEKLPKEYKGKFDYVINGGTLEHVFDVATAIDNMSAMVKDGGLILHLSPAAGWIDHGFFSFSPTFFVDYYIHNGWDIKTIEMEIIPENGHTCFSDDIRTYRDEKELNESINRLVAQGYGFCNRAMLLCIAEKKNKDLKKDYPIQGIYNNVFSSTNTTGKQLDFKKIAKEIKSVKGKKIAFYGGGELCDVLIDELYKINGEDMVDAILDKNVTKSKSLHRGYRVYYPGREVVEKYDMIYICSLQYEKEMLANLEGMDINVEIKRISQYLLKD